MESRRGVSILLAAVLAASTQACLAAPESADSNGAAIINGTASDEAEDAVVFLRIGDATCTGTLVAPNLLLTARHCVSVIDERGVVSRDRPANTIEVYSGRTTSEQGSANARGRELVTNRRVGSTLEGYDIAFVVLDRNVGAKTAPLRLSSGARDGETLTAVGWGLTENGDLPTRRLKRDVVVAGGQGGIFAVGEGICFGDSGGPALSSRGAVVGVAAALSEIVGEGEQDSNDRTASCRGEDAFGSFTELSRHRSLASRAFEAAGARARIEGVDAVGKAPGESCERDRDCAAEDCSSGRCGGASDANTDDDGPALGTSSDDEGSSDGAGKGGSGSSEDDGSGGGKSGGGSGKDEDPSSGKG
jgi:V8-like Glu-specific endopeptidase